MPRPPKPSTPSSLVASAANVTALPQQSRIKRGGATTWQGQAWDFYDIVGELRFGASWIGQALSRVRLVIKRRTDDGDEDVEDGPAREALDALFGGETGQSQMLSTLGVHLFVPGESYLVGEPQQGAPDEWLILSNDEMTRRGQTWQVDRGDGKRPLAPDSLVIRIWQPHPRRWLEATSSVRAVLPSLIELEQLTKHVSATTDSRLAGAGILLLPQEMSFTSPDGHTVSGDSDGDLFTQALTEAMLKPIADRGDANAVVPIVVKAPAAVLASAQHLTFSTPFDAQAQSLREEAIRRLALGLNLPVEVVLGQGDSNHWSAWQVEESTLKVHIEPMCELITDALTQQYLRPVLEAYGGQNEWDPALYIEADTSDLRLRPDHSEQAVLLYDRLELSGAALRRETGFDETDAPNPAEVNDALLKMIARGSTADAPVAATRLGVALPTSGAGAVPASPTPDAPPAIEPDPENVRAIPEATANAVLAACEATVLRAIERANNRLHRRGPGRPVSTLHAIAALENEWGYVPRLAELLAVDEQRLLATLSAYAVSRVSTAQAHEPEALLRALTTGRVDA